MPSTWHLSLLAVAKDSRFFGFPIVPVLVATSSFAAFDFFGAIDRHRHSRIWLASDKRTSFVIVVIVFVIAALGFRDPEEEPFYLSLRDCFVVLVIAALGSQTAASTHRHRHVADPRYSALVIL